MQKDSPSAEVNLKFHVDFYNCILFWGSLFFTKQTVRQSVCIKQIMYLNFFNWPSFHEVLGFDKFSVSIKVEKHVAEVSRLCSLLLIQQLH